MDYIGNELELFQYANNWKAYWSSVVGPHIKGSTLEVGAGLGGNVDLLIPFADEYVALEPDPKLAQEILERPGLEVRVGTTETMDDNKIYDTVLYIDVLEHIQNDRAEFLRAVRLLKTGGNLIVLCPAHQYLYSPFDKAVGHFKRYSKKDFRAFNDLGGDTALRKLTYLDSTGMLASLANKTLLKSSLPTPKQIKFWDSVLVPMSKFTDKLSFGAVGKTVIGVWQKTG